MRPRSPAFWIGAQLALAALLCAIAFLTAGRWGFFLLPMFFVIPLGGWRRRRWRRARPRV